MQYKQWKIKKFFNLNKTEYERAEGGNIHKYIKKLGYILLNSLKSQEIGKYTEILLE